MFVESNIYFYMISTAVLNNRLDFSLIQPAGVVMMNIFVLIHFISIWILLSYFRRKSKIMKRNFQNNNEEEIKYRRYITICVFGFVLYMVLIIGCLVMDVIFTAPCMIAIYILATLIYLWNYHIYNYESPISKVTCLLSMGLSLIFALLIKLLTR